MSVQPSSATPALDAAGRRRSPATIPGYHAGRAPKHKGLTYPADPPTVDEIVAVMRQAGDSRHGLRARGLIVVLWHAALRIQEALALTESDLDPRRSSVLVRERKGGHRREVGIDSWALNTGLRPWLEVRPCPSDRCSASSTDPPRAPDRGQAPPSAPSSATSPPTPASGGALPHTS